MSPDDLKTLGILYRHASSDLSYASSFGYDQKLIAYLNGCVGKAYAEIYRDEPFTMKQISLFFLKTWPAKVRMHGALIVTACLIFAITAVLTYVQVYLRPELASYVVPESLLGTIEKGIGKKPQVSSLSLEEKSALSHQIMTNNIIVGINAFAMGIFYGLGTVYLLITNAALLGALAALCARNHEALLFWSLILPHGVMELTAVFICGGAGFLLAQAMINPGKLYRIDALRKNGADAAHLMLGVILLFIVAAVIEGFLTPLPVSPQVKIIFSGMVSILLVWYLAGR